MTHHENNTQHRQPSSQVRRRTPFKLHPAVRGKLEGDSLNFPPVTQITGCQRVSRADGSFKRVRVFLLVCWDVPQSLPLIRLHGEPTERLHAAVNAQPVTQQHIHDPLQQERFVSFDLFKTEPSDSQGVSVVFYSHGPTSTLRSWAAGVRGCTPGTRTSR